MKLKQSLLLAGVSQAVAAGMVMASSPASAAQLYNFSYSGTGIDATGTLTLGAPGTDPGSFLITGITGERNGVAITSLLPVGSYPVGSDPVTGDPAVPNDNLFFPNQDIKLSFAGFSFQTVDGNKYNPYYDAEVKSYRECSTTGCAVEDPKVTFTSTAVPEPASVLGLVAFGALGATLTRKKKLVVQKAEA
ncbi:PEP-CTERM sorting domain-containing protein [Microseira wollei]|uniref:Ice-binding protein C-terminal domain-containing protein n=1 Tax=Microseira wollei NIES-4236 TaxID=2530354 RepID=A0AAV3XLR7_9CYAN|nr:PEP-CTERM sorting domain-containing protein [Microseira wollei]GET41407.1 hypothetical protein MiSe_62190 [Microseira wollei NIES-4236]